MKRIIWIILGLSVVFISKAADNKTGVYFYEAGMYGPAKLFFLKQLQSTEGNNAENHYYLGSSYLMLGKADSAAFYFEKGIKTDPSNPFNYVGKGMLSLKNDATVAERQFKEAEGMKGYRKNVALELAIARAYLYVRDENAVKTAIEKAKKYDATNPEIYLVEGDMLMQEKQPGEACTCYDMAIYYDASCIPAYLKQAAVYGPTNKASALASVNKAIENFPDFPGSYYCKGELHRMAGDYGKAVKAYARYMNTGLQTTEHMLHYASCLYFNEQYAEALPVLETVVASEPDNVVGRRLQAYIYAETKPGEEGVDRIRKFVETTSPEDLIAQDYVCYAKSLAGMMDYANALKQYQKALAIDKEKNTLYMEMADLQMKMKDYANALQNYEQYFGEEKQLSAEELLKFGKCYYSLGNTDSIPETRQRELHLADSVFALLTEAVPSSYVGYFWRARTNSQLDPESTQGLAKPYYEKIIEITQSNPQRYAGELIESYKYLAYYNYIHEDLPAAKEYFEKVLQVAPDDEVALKALQELK